MEQEVFWSVPICFCFSHFFLSCKIEQTYRNTHVINVYFWLFLQKFLCDSPPTKLKKKIRDLQSPRNSQIRTGFRGLYLEHWYKAWLWAESLLGLRLCCCILKFLINSEQGTLCLLHKLCSFSCPQPSFCKTFKCALLPWVLNHCFLFSL